MLTSFIEPKNFQSEGSLRTYYFDEKDIFRLFLLSSYQQMDTIQEAYAFYRHFKTGHFVWGPSWKQRMNPTDPNVKINVLFASET